MAFVEIDGVSKSYGDVTALRDVSVSIPEGEFVVVLGASGAGKSTLLRCLNGLTTPDAGTITVAGTEITGPRDDVAMIFQQHNVIGQLSAYANALTGALHRTNYLRSLAGSYAREDEREALAALRTVGLLDEADQPAHSMSGGQQQRVGIARALVQRPTLLLADEPVASLDPASAETVMGYIRAAADDRNLTAIASLHQVNVAREFGERFVGLRDGEVVFDGNRDEFTIDVVDRIYGEDVRTVADADPGPDSGPTTTPGDADPTADRDPDTATEATDGVPNVADDPGAPTPTEPEGGS